MGDYVDEATKRLQDGDSIASVRGDLQNKISQNADQSTTPSESYSTNRGQYPSGQYPSGQYPYGQYPTVQKSTLANQLIGSMASLALGYAQSEIRNGQTQNVYKQQADASAQIATTQANLQSKLASDNAQRQLDFQKKQIDFQSQQVKLQIELVNAKLDSEVQLVALQAKALDDQAKYYASLPSGAPKPQKSGSPTSAQNAAAAQAATQQLNANIAALKADKVALLIQQQKLESQTEQLAALSPADYQAWQQSQSSSTASSPTSSTANSQTQSTDGTTDGNTDSTLTQQQQNDAQAAQLAAQQQQLQATNSVQQQGNQQQTCDLRCALPVSAFQPNSVGLSNIRTLCSNEGCPLGSVGFLVPDSRD